MPRTPLLELRKFLAPEFVFGDGALDLAGRYARNIGMRRPLLVTDPGVLAAGWTDRVRESLHREGIEWRFFSDVRPNPRMDEVAEGAEVYRSEGCDSLVAVGGGSPMDCAKGIGIVVANGGAIRDYEGVDRVAEPMPPMLCVPTTGGTASEVSQFAIINNSDERRKMSIVSKAVVPDLALIDPATLTTMSSELTACTGMDALSHAFEAVASTGGSPLTRLHALDAVRRVTAALSATIERPDDLEARGEVMLGSLQAGLAFSNASLGAVHAAAHSLGGLKDLPHGECNALLLEHVVDFNFASAEDAYRAIAEAMGLDLRGLDGAGARSRLTGAIRGLRERVGLDATLGRRGVTRDEVGPLAENALRDACMVTNPRRPVRRDIEVIYEEAL